MDDSKVAAPAPTAPSTLPSFIDTNRVSEEEELVIENDVQPNTSGLDKDGSTPKQQPPNAASPHSDNHRKLPHPLSEVGPDSNQIINESGHYSYIVVIASPADQMARRRLIREKYFGLRNNILPCMHYNTDIMYKFWIYGPQIPSNTAARRRYEAEKMEWNDLEEMEPNVLFEQIDILKWAETSLAEQGITYDYLIVQDIHTFIQLSTIKEELDSGVISESTNSPVTLNTEAPTNLVWGIFSGGERDKHAFVIGSAAVRLALQKQSDIEKHGQKPHGSEHLLTNMYKYYESIAGLVEDEVDATLDPEAAAEVQEQVLPVFVREDGPEDAHRFIRWENNIESVHAEDIVVTHVYQDDEFAELSYWTNSNDLALNTTLVTSSGKPAIALMTSSYIYDDNCMEPSATLAAMNKRKYALRHGHSFVARSAEFAQQRGRKTVWGKMDAVEKVLPKYDWIFWMDMDAVIMNQEHSLFELLDDLKQRYDGEFEGIDLIAAKPRGDPMLNAGVFFLRYSPWSMQFLRDVQGVVEWYNKGPSYEQGAMWQMMQLEENRPHIFLLENDDHTFNTFPKRYQPGDFIVHFAPDKCPNELTLQGLKAAERIERGERITQLDLL
ncbi:galactosyl transferase GMA12/MNN10 family-domain-containing protein [Dichotomocladium elegans]|nr:galactosyl transferase GMA12/MNN10 family-domain-containing protein [Dichotomocladium elegans]